MQTIRTNLLRALGLLLTFLLLAVPTFGQAVRITIAPRWNPNFSLTSLNVGNIIFPSEDGDGFYEPGTDDDDTLLMGVNIYATTNVEFWAADISCTVPPAVALLYQQNLLNANPNDDSHLFFAGAPWSNGGTYEMVSRPIDVNPATGTIKAAISRLSGSSGLGLNGLDSTIELGYFQFIVKPQIATFSGTVSITCTVALLDRSGRTIGAPVFQAPAPAVIRAGYSISGNVKYQGAATHAGIGINCQDDQLPTPNVLTNVRTLADGSWRIDGLRKDGYWKCTAYGNLITPEAANVPPTQESDVHTSQFSWTYLRRANWTFLPVTLLSGNLERTNFPNAIETIFDLVRVTGNYGATAPTPYGLGDANGDRLVNRSDLAIVTANIGMENAEADHVILSAQRAPSATLFDNRIWLNSNPLINASVTFNQLILGGNRDYWPSLSPDGTTLVVAREIASVPTKLYALFTMPANGTGVATRISPVGWAYNAFAPSWSPDGTRIAFVCSQADSYKLNRGNLCVIDANGRNLVVTQALTKLYPPTWRTQDAVIFGGHADDIVCPNTLCEYRTINAFQNFIDYDLISVASNIGSEDMPSFRDGLLYYRYDADNNFANGGTELRVATYDYDGNADPITLWQAAPGGPGCCSTDYHVTVTNSFDVDYYAVKTNGEPQLYVQAYELLPGYRSSLNWYFVTDDGNFSSGGALGYTTFSSFSWNNVYSNPAWDGLVLTPSDLHALRTTLAFVP